MRLLLDTQVVLLQLAGERPLSHEAGKAVAEADDLLFSVTSFAEIGIKAAVGKLVVPAGRAACFVRVNAALSSPLSCAGSDKYAHTGIPDVLRDWFVRWSRIHHRRLTDKLHYVKLSACARHDPPLTTITTPPPPVRYCRTHPHPAFRNSTVVAERAWHVPKQIRAAIVVGKRDRAKPRHTMTAPTEFAIFSARVRPGPSYKFWLPGPLLGHWPRLVGYRSANTTIASADSPMRSSAWREFHTIPEARVPAMRMA